MNRWLTLICDTKRLTVSGTGQSSALATNLTGVSTSEFMPVSAEIRTRLMLDTPNELMQVFCGDAVDLKVGDYIRPLNSQIVPSAVDYPVRAVERWPWATGQTFKMAVVEDLKR